METEEERLQAIVEVIRQSARDFAAAMPTVQEAARSLQNFGIALAKEAKSVVLPTEER